MVNVLILDDNISFAINLLNYLNYKKENIRICGILKSEMQILKTLSSEKKIDIILLNNDIGLGILNKIDFNDRYRKSIIILNYETQDLNELRSNPLIYSGVPKEASVEEMYQKINMLIEIKEIQERDKGLNDRIAEELLYLGYELSKKGTKYLIEAISYMFINVNNDVDRLEKQVYPVISKRYKDSMSNVKSNIIRTHNAWYSKCEHEKIKKYFKMNVLEKPKIKTVINTVIKKINKKVG